MSRFLSALSAAIVVLLLSAFAAPAAETAPASTDPHDWRLLFAGGELRDGTGALKSQLPGGSGIFSRNGTRLAGPKIDCLDNGCNSVRGTVRLSKPDGTSSLLAWVADLDPWRFAWSPDGSEVAVLGRVITPGDTDIRIYIFPVDGSPAKLVYSDTRLVRINLSDGISWNPVDDRLAFVASEFDQEGFSVPGGTDQVFTVPAAPASTPTRYSGTPVCGDCTHVPGYSRPNWGPDGSRLAVVVDDPTAPFGEQLPPFLGYLAQGALSANKLNNAVPQGPLAFSDDGSYLAYGIGDTSGDFYDDTEIVDAHSGARVTLVEGVIPEFADWLPCPGGTCPVWQNVYTPPTPGLNIKGVAKRAKVKVSGEMFRVPEVASVAVTLSKRVRAGAKWRKVTTVQVQAVEGLFKRSFPRPDAVKCRARGIYDDGTSRAVDTAVFAC